MTRSFELLVLASTQGKSAGSVRWQSLPVGHGKWTSPVRTGSSQIGH
jgi:hypothetical protein